ncbi:hypothetical protein D9M68_716540 [compost metagenome]
MLRKQSTNRRRKTHLGIELGGLFPFGVFRSAARLGIGLRRGCNRLGGTATHPTEKRPRGGIGPLT